VKDRTIARNYAEALFELGRAHGEGEAYASAFEALDEALESDDRIRRFLETPKVEAAAKEAVVRRALEGRVPELFLRFVLVTLAKRRHALLGLIQEEYQTLLDAHAGRVHARVTLARQPDAGTVELIGARLSRMLDKDVVPHITIDPAILGGLVVRYGDYAMDGSLRRQLVSLKREMMHAGLPGTAAA
jgi:F-type H+-transporting ATPase subunit delta